mmetsp:Transcript_140433/g.244515  ORF Transcript_140433/g.244515 Transcript_140433/m.244515 type:complete len:500 (+) Transcript_140433:108-1607(+)
MRCTVSWDAWLLLLLWVSPLASAAGASYEEQNKEVTPVAASCAVRTAEDALADWVSALQTGLELHGLRANATSDEQPRRVELFQRTIKSATTAFLNRQREPVSVVLILLVVIFTPLFVALVLLNWAEEPRKQFPMPPSSPGISSIQSSVRLPVRLPPQPVFHDREDTRASGGAAAGSNLLFSNPFNRYSMADFNSSVSLPSAPALPEWSFGGGAGGGFGISNETAQEIVDAERAAGVRFSEAEAEVSSGMANMRSGMMGVRSGMAGMIRGGITSSLHPLRGSGTRQSRVDGLTHLLSRDQSRTDGILEPMAVIQDPHGMHLRMIGSPTDFRQETDLNIFRDDNQVILRLLISESSADSEILLQSVHRIPMAYMTTKYCVRQRGAKKIPRQERVAYIYDVPPVDGGLEEAIFATARPIGDCDNVIGIWTGAVASGPAWYQVRTAGLSQSNIVDRRGALIATTTAQMDSSGRQNHAFFLTAGADAAMVVMAFVAAKKCSDQ